MSTMGNLTHGLSKKIGPLKAWQWGLIAGGGIIVFTVLKKNGLSLTGKTATETEESSAGLYDAGTSTTGTGTSGGSDNGTAPEAIQITITAAEPAASETTSEVDSSRVSDLESQLAKSQAEVAKQKAAKRDWADWGKKWKTQAAKNAGRKVKTTQQKKTQGTKKKALPTTPKGKRVGGHTFPTPRKPATSAKRNQAGTRTIAARTAQRRVHTPRKATPAKRKK